MTAVERITNGEQRRWEHKFFIIERDGEHIITRFKQSATATAILGRGKITTQLSQNGWKRCDSTSSEYEGWLTTLWERA